MLSTALPRQGRPDLSRSKRDPLFSPHHLQGEEEGRFHAEKGEKRKKRALREQSVTTSQFKPKRLQSNSSPRYLLELSKLKNAKRVGKLTVEGLHHCPRKEEWNQVDDDRRRNTNRPREGIRTPAKRKGKGRLKGNENVFGECSRVYKCVRQSRARGLHDAKR